MPIPRLTRRRAPSHIGASAGRPCASGALLFAADRASSREGGTLLHAVASVAIALALAVEAATAPGPDSSATPAPADTAGPRIVRRLDEFVVRGARLHDPRSSETVHLIPSRALRALPVDNLAQAVALKAGVVAQAEELHVRGGRAGETCLMLGGITLNDALSDRALELPLLAVKSASLVSGGMDAEYGGSPAGVLDVPTVDPGPRWNGESPWRTDGRRGAHCRRASARVGVPPRRRG